MLQVTVKSQYDRARQGPPVWTFSPATVLLGAQGCKLRCSARRGSRYHRTQRVRKNDSREAIVARNVTQRRYNNAERTPFCLDRIGCRISPGFDWIRKHFS